MKTHGMKSMALHNSIIKNEQQYKSYFKYLPKFCRNIGFDRHEGSIFYSSFPGDKHFKMQKRLLKLSKRTKYAQGLILEWNIGSSEISAPKIVKAAKNLSRIQSLAYEEIVQAKVPKLFLTKWIEQAKELKTLNLSLQEEGYFSSRPIGEKQVDYKEQVSRLFRATEARRLKKLIFQECRASNISLSKPCFDFKKYPKTLSTLKIFNFLELKNNTPKAIDSSHFPNLENVNLHITDQFLLDSAQTTFVNSSKITSLNINLRPHGKGSSIALSINNILALKNLQNLKLTTQSWTADLDKLFSAANGLSLKKFGLYTEIKQESEILPLIKYLPSQTKLEYFDLHLNNTSKFSSQGNLHDLLKEVSQLRELKTLKLHIRTTVKLGKKDVLLELGESLRPLFTNSPGLTKFRFFCNQFDAQKTFPVLLTDLKPILVNLESLEINLFDEYKPDKTQFSFVIDFLASLQSIQVLGLDSLSVPLNAFLQDLVSTVYTMKFLRILRFGQVKGTITKDAFVSTLERILSKYGLREFACDLSIEFTRSLAKKTKSTPKIDVSIVYKNNPHLEKLPQGCLGVTLDRDSKENINNWE